jgi:hypothetical protein
MFRVVEDGAKRESYRRQNYFGNSMEKPVQQTNNAIGKELTGQK